MSFGKWRPFYLGLNVLKRLNIWRSQQNGRYFAEHILRYIFLTQSRNIMIFIDFFMGMHGDRWVLP